MRNKIQRVIDEKINPMVAQHGGAIHLVDYANKTAFIRMSWWMPGVFILETYVTTGR